MVNMSYLIKLLVVNNVYKSLSDLSPFQMKYNYLDYLDRTIIGSDFENMQKAGIDTVKVPFGYWNFFTNKPDYFDNENIRGYPHFIG